MHHFHFKNSCLSPFKNVLTDKLNHVNVWVYNILYNYHLLSFNQFSTEMDETGRTTVPTVGPRLYMLYERFCDVRSQLGTTCSLLKELVTECKNTPYELSFTDEMTQASKLIMLYDRVFGITSQLNTTCCLVKDLATEYQHLPDTLYRAEQFKGPEHMSLQE